MHKDDQRPIAPNPSDILVVLAVSHPARVRPRFRPLCQVFSAWRNASPAACVCFIPLGRSSTSTAPSSTYTNVGAVCICHPVSPPGAISMSIAVTSALSVLGYATGDPSIAVLLLRSVRPVNLTWATAGVAARDAAISTKRPIDLMRHLLGIVLFEAPHGLRYGLESFQAQGLTFPGSDAWNSLTLERFQGAGLR